MVGAATACLLARQGLDVVVLESALPEPFSAEQPMDLRVSAISAASIKLLQKAGGWEAVLAMRETLARLIEERFATRRAGTRVAA